MRKRLDVNGWWGASPPASILPRRLYRKPRYTSRDGRKVPGDDNDAWLKPAFAEMYRVLERDRFAVRFYGWLHADRFLAAFRGAGFRADEPVKQHAYRWQVLLYGRFGESREKALHLASDVHRLYLGQVVHATLGAEFRELAGRIVVSPPRMLITGRSR